MATWALAGRQHDLAIARVRWSTRLRRESFGSRCEGAMTKKLTPGLGPVPLTRREREIAQLAAQGLPSKLIAERLFLSARTVDNHLARASDKLGVRTRAELARLYA